MKSKKAKGHYKILEFCADPILNSPITRFIVLYFCGVGQNFTLVSHILIFILKI